MTTLSVIRPRIVTPIAESWSILDVAQRRPPLGWLNVFADAIPELEDVSDIVTSNEQEGGYRSYPLRADLFNAFRCTPLERVRVVIVGQDPYPGIDSYTGKPQAIGMSFAVRRGVTIPSSLRNIFKELERSMPNDFRMPSHGDLTYWAGQGVLLLNTGLTVRPGVPGSHGDIWMGLVVKVLATLAERCPDAIYMLWGAQAQKLRAKGYIGDRAICLEAPHPSGRSAHLGFIGCNHFVLANQILTTKGEAPIDWNLPQ